LAEHSDQPAYFVFRLDKQNKFGYAWLLIMYVPDTCKVKQKMLMSSTAETVRKGLGATYFAGLYHISTKSELTFKGYSWIDKSERYKNQEDLMTEEERIRHEEKQTSVGEYIGGPTTSNVHGVNFPTDDTGMAKLKEFSQNQIKLVVLKIENEKIVLDVAVDSITGDEIMKKVPEDQPRFIFFNYTHTFENTDMNSVFFIYFCPIKSKIKQRMVYSSAKQAVLTAAKDAGVNIDKSMEASEIGDITTKYLHDYIHPPKVEEVKFSKPKRPGKGRARIAK